jgi:hypothetical protein
VQLKAAPWPLGADGECATNLARLTSASPATSPRSLRPLPPITTGQQGIVHCRPPLCPPQSSPATPRLLRASGPQAPLLWPSLILFFFSPQRLTPHQQTTNPSTIPPHPPPISVYHLPSSSSPLFAHCLSRRFLCLLLRISSPILIFSAFAPPFDTLRHDGFAVSLQHLFPLAPTPFATLPPPAPAPREGCLHQCSSSPTTHGQFRISLLTPSSD